MPRVRLFKLFMFLSFSFFVMNPLYAASPYGSCSSTLSSEAYRDLLELSDPQGLESIQDARETIKTIAEVFAEAKDRRGIFSAMYLEITDAAVSAIDAGEFNDLQLASKLTIRFLQRYLEALQANLLEERFEKENAVWQSYYSLADDCSVSGLRVLAAAVNAHLSFDLPYAVAEVSAPDNFREDFVKFGDLLIKRKKASTDRLWDLYGIDAEDFFDGFFLGKAFDQVFGEGAASLLGFQVIRLEAWAQSRNLQNPVLRPLAAAAIKAAWASRELVLNALN
jgi:hypothetical protein